MSLQDWLARVKGEGAILTRQDGDVVVYHIGGRTDLPVYLRSTEELYANMPAATVDALGPRATMAPEPAGGVNASVGGGHQTEAQTERQSSIMDHVDAEMIKGVVLVLLSLVGFAILARFSK